MYIITPQFIRDYITQNFSDRGKLSANGREFIMESVFVPNDWKKHLSINIDSGLWQCFKSGRSGNFTSFYAKVEDLSYFRAQKELIIKNFEFLGEEVPELARTEQQLELDTSELIPITLSSAYSEDKDIVAAWSFLFGRKLFIEDYEEEAPFYLCTKGKFHNRIIIPFVKDDIVYFFQGRTLLDARPKYLNPSTEIAPRSSDILYPYEEDADHLVICEGPLDARSLQLQGVNATCTLGCSVSPRQAEILSTFGGKIVVGYDNDEAGRRGIEKFETLRKERRMPKINICPLPESCKDWNEAHVKNINLLEWVMNNSVEYNFQYQIKCQLKKV
jgi:DNA primase